MVTAKDNKPLNAVYRWGNATLARADRWQRQRLARRELMALDDHMLEDVGLRRWEIDAVVNRMFPEAADARRTGGKPRADKRTEKTTTPANDRYYDSAA